MMVDEDDGGSVNFNDDAFVHCWDNCRPTVWIQRLLPRTTQRLLTKKMLLAKGKILGPVKDSYQKNAARKRKKSRSILEVSFPTEIRYRDSVDNLDDSDGGDS